MGFEPTTFCMASRRSSQLSYSRARPDSSFAVPSPASAPLGAGYPATEDSLGPCPFFAHSRARSKAARFNASPLSLSLASRRSSQLSYSRAKAKSVGAPLRGSRAYSS
jgi:hypothetical protein